MYPREAPTLLRLHQACVGYTGGKIPMGTSDVYGTHAWCGNLPSEAFCIGCFFFPREQGKVTMSQFDVKVS